MEASFGSTRRSVAASRSTFWDLDAVLPTAFEVSTSSLRSIAWPGGLVDLTLERGVPCAAGGQLPHRKRAFGSSRQLRLRQLQALDRFAQRDGGGVVADQLGRVDQLRHRPSDAFARPTQAFVLVPIGVGFGPIRQCHALSDEG
jgi:hypothetical protein